MTFVPGIGESAGLARVAEHGASVIERAVCCPIVCWLKDRIVGLIAFSGKGTGWRGEDE